MALPILTTKLFIPPTDRRPSRALGYRLIERLNQGIDGRFSLITAPAGFGKTTLVNVNIFVDSFTGRDRRVADYLLTEVLSRKTEDIQNFLLQTSVLERFNDASLCADVLGREDPMCVQQFLEALETTDLFIIPLDYERYWYRYHHPFAELLRQRLQSKLSTEEIAWLYNQTRSVFLMIVFHALSKVFSNWLLTFLNLEANLHHIRFLPLLVLAMTDPFVIAQVDAGNPWFRPVIGYSLPVFLVIGLALIGVWIWARWQERKFEEFLDESK